MPSGIGCDTLAVVKLQPLKIEQNRMTSITTSLTWAESLDVLPSGILGPEKLSSPRAKVWSPNHTWSPHPQLPAEPRRPLIPPSSWTLLFVVLVTRACVSKARALPLNYPTPSGHPSLTEHEVLSKPLLGALLPPSQGASSLFSTPSSFTGLPTPAPSVTAYAAFHCLPPLEIHLVWSYKPPAWYNPPQHLPL